MAAVNPAFMPAMQQPMPMRAPVQAAIPAIAITKKVGIFTKAWGTILIVGVVMLVLGVCTVGFTLYGTQRTTAQILLNQPAAIQNPKNGLKYGGYLALAGGGVVGLHVAVAFIAHKLHH